MRIIDSYRISLFVASILMIMLGSCNRDEMHMMSRNMAHQFAKPSEAADQAKEDLITLAEQEQLMDLNLNPIQIQKSHFENIIEWIDLDMDELMHHDSLTDYFDDIVILKQQIFPLYLDSKLLTSVSVRVENGVWTACGIRNQRVERDIDELRKFVPRLNESRIVLFEISQLNAFVYYVNLNGVENYYTNYHGHVLFQPINFQEFTTLLKNELAFILSKNQQGLDQRMIR